MDISELTDNLVFKEGIWYSVSSLPISYPDVGNDVCFAIEDSSFWFNHRNKIILELLNNFPPKGVTIDVGGGNGFVTREIENSGRDAILLEPGLAGVLNAKKRNISNIICSSFQDVSFNSQSSVSIGIFDVLEHIENDQEFLEAIYHSLKKGSRLYISVPAYQFLWSDADIFADHFRRYSLRTLKEKLVKAKFKIEFASYIFSFLPAIILLLKSIPFRLGFKQKESGIRKEHSTSNKLVEWILKKETSIIRRKRRIFFGGSCIVVAVK